MNKTIDFINIQQSNSIKAIIMLLIVLGHNHILAPNNESSHLFGYLYRFHVSIFFILPFFYDRYDSLCKEAINKIIVRNIIPYVLFFLLCYLLYHFIIIKDGFNPKEFLFGLVNAPGYNVKNTSGFVFLWFLPVFMLMSLCKLFANRYKWLMILFFFTGFIICVSWDAYVFMWKAPFYILKALFYYSMGMSAYILSKNVKYINYLGIISFIVLTILYWTDIYYAQYFYFSLSAFFILKELTSKIDFSKIPFISLIGKYSLPIYLTHVFIYNVLERLLPNTLIWGIVIYFITIGLSLTVSICIYKIEVIRKFLFPRSWQEWTHFYQKTKVAN